MGSSMSELVYNYGQLWISGIITTVSLTILAIIIALFLSLALAWLKLKEYSVISGIIDIYLYLVRGTPFLIQLFLIYYGSGQISWINNSFLGDIFANAFISGLIALIINSTAYATVLIYGGLQNLNRDELLSAKASGLSSWQSFIYIMLPSLFYRIFPAYINEMIMVLKCSALVSTITVLDITGSAQEIISDSYQSLNTLLIAAVFYLLITLILAVPTKAIFSWMFNKRFKRI